MGNSYMQFSSPTVVQPGRKSQVQEIEPESDISLAGEFGGSLALDVHGSALLKHFSVI